MTNIPFFGNYNRGVLKSAPVGLKNRFFERNPVLSEDPVAAVSRPSMEKLLEIGTGPIRKVFSSPGVFDGDLFVVSGDQLYRVAPSPLVATLIGTISTGSLSSVSMCTTAPIGTIPAYLYIAEGSVLWVYTENGHASAHLEITGAIANGDVIRLDDTYYQWTTGSLAGGTGTVGTPWLVAIGGSPSVSTTNMYNAVTATGEEGVDYTTGLTANPTVHGTSYNSTDMFFEAIEPGVDGNAFESTETGANLSFGGATFSGGGTDQIRQVYLPDDNGAISVAHINSYVIVVPVQLDDIKGRFYWIEPGENTIDALNFATAERNPDGIHQVVVFGDLFWLMGEDTTEPWITTGDLIFPMERYRGILFDRGSWEGTAVQVKDSLIVTDEDGAVFQIAGGQNRISTPAVEERIRRAIQTQTRLGY